jgi:DNA helicase HerA-like ATPase
VLNIGAGLTLPVEAVTETFAILAKRGVGKTYTAAVMVEEMVAAGLPVVVVDPIGVWWGLRSPADGRPPARHRRRAHRGTGR